ncbi:MAG: regulatory protein RecX, partial [Giesbergeria sp.]
MAALILSLKARALRSLARREYTRAELRRKLVPHEETDGQLDALLDVLQAQGLLSDERAAASLVHRRAARLGTQRLRQELQAKGLDASTVDA